MLIDPDEICDSQPMSLSLDETVVLENTNTNTSKCNEKLTSKQRPAKGTGQYGQFRSVEEIGRYLLTYSTYNNFWLLSTSNFPAWDYLYNILVWLIGTVFVSVPIFLMFVFQMKNIAVFSHTRSLTWSNQMLLTMHFTQVSLFYIHPHNYVDTYLIRSHIAITNYLH